MNEVKTAADKLISALKERGEITPNHCGEVTISTHNGSVSNKIKVIKTVKAD
jgi:hypothetical protein